MCLWEVLLYNDGQGVPVVALTHLCTGPCSWVAYGWAVIVPNWVMVLLIPPCKVVVNEVPVLAMSVEHQVAQSYVPMNKSTAMNLV